MGLIFEGILSLNHRFRTFEYVRARWSLENYYLVSGDRLLFKTYLYRDLKFNFNHGQKIIRNFYLLFSKLMALSCLYWTEGIAGASALGKLGRTSLMSTLDLTNREFEWFGQGRVRYGNCEHNRAKNRHARQTQTHLVKWWRRTQLKIKDEN